VELIAELIHYLGLILILAQMLNLQAVDSILITGSNGFVGRSIIEYLGKLDKSLLPREIILATRNGLTYKIPESLFPLSRTIEQDLLTEWQFRANPSHIINLAADGSRSPYSQESSDSYVLLNGNLVNWMSRQEKEITIFHASTGACFGYKPLLPGSETIESKKIFIEARIKVEDNLRKFSSQQKIPLSIGRLFSFTGINLLSKNQYAVTSFINSAFSRNRIEVLGDPLTVRSYLHQDSMSEWILRALTDSEENFCYQIGSNEAVTIGQLAEFIALETGAEIDYSEEPSSGDIYIPNNSETRIKLGVEEGKGWKEAVLEMIAKARMLNNVTE
jgi:nucleoside-diphosphate-sugar epimerase